MTQSWTPAVDRFCHQYLQLEPLPAYPAPSSLRLSQVQDAIHERLFADGAVRYGPPARYQLRVLKELVARVEGSIDDWDEHEVSENLMSALAVLLCAPLPPETASVQQKCYVSYYLSQLPKEYCAASTSKPYITLLEHRALIAAGGTTGLRTWEAALHLGQFLSLHAGIVRGRNVLELGAGTGYLSILCAKYLGSQHVVASDGSDEVIDNLPENLLLNDLAAGSEVIEPMNLKWGEALAGPGQDEQWNSGRPVDVVLGADVTYDDELIPQLVTTLLDLFRRDAGCEAYIAATQRNERTFEVFLTECERNDLHVEDLRARVPAPEVQEGPFYSDYVAIRLCRVWKG